MTSRLLRFQDLKDRNIVRNRPTLQRWIAEEQFPPGRKLAANSRAWTEIEIQEWLDSRPIERGRDLVADLRPLRAGRNMSAPERSTKATRKQE